MDLISKEVLGLNGKDTLKIHGIQTGKLAIKKSALDSIKPGLISTVLSFKDKEFSNWLPIWTWVIEHPEGNFLIDTGLSSDVNQKEYFKDIDFISRYYFEKQMKFEIKRTEEIDYQLQKIDLDTDAISKVVLTHLHIDHTGGLKYFPNTPILINDKEWKTQDGAFSKLFPPELNIETIQLENRFECFDECYFLTKSKDLVMIPTPGHTRGHVSIALLANDNVVFLFGGDVAYTKEKLKSKVFSTTIKNHKKNIESCDKILELAKTKKVVFLPCHDGDNVERLKNEEVLS